MTIINSIQKRIKFIINALLPPTAKFKNLGNDYYSIHLVLFPKAVGTLFARSLAQLLS